MTYKRKKPVPREKIVPDAKLGRNKAQTEERPCPCKLEERSPYTRVEPIERR